MMGITLIASLYFSRANKIFIFFSSVSWLSFLSFLITLIHFKEVKVWGIKNVDKYSDSLEKKM